MSSGKCKNCGCSEIDVDPARGDAVCTNCGSVLEDSIIVSEVQFEENAHGGSSALGQFVSSDSKGGARGFGGSFHVGLGKESREITLRNAKRAIVNLAQQLRLNQHCTETAFNFYKMALQGQLTRGRRNTHVVAACVYMTCRIEATPHMLIDFSDVLQICVYELGRTYLRLSQALCINIPSIDPCLYILRFANRLEFGDKTHDVSMTALRLVQRMKKDSIHIGRRPSGLCGAALLMAARLHEFNRTVSDIIKIVKVHKSTVRKRLIEFGETPSSSLTLDEFMTVDLEEEQDPPSFKAARKKDRERLQKMVEEEETVHSFNELQQEIERQLEEKASLKKAHKRTQEPEADSDRESQDADRFIVQSTLGTIHDYIADDPDPETVDNDVQDKQVDEHTSSLSTGLGPDIASMGLANSMDDCPDIRPESNCVEDGNGEIDLTGIDDDEIDSYIMSEQEAQYKDSLWMKINATYLKEQKEKEERLAREKEEGKPEKKKRKPCQRKPKNNNAANSAGEAIEKMLQEKKISSKINYDVLKSLNVKSLDTPQTPTKETSESSTILTKRPENISLFGSPERRRTDMTLDRLDNPVQKPKTARAAPRTDGVIRKNKVITGQDSPIAAMTAEEPQQAVAERTELAPEPELDDADEFEDEHEVEHEQNDQMSLTQMLNHHREDDDYYGGYEYDEY
ncbi:transcription factor IIIB 90 kDa subunit isoform X1 [Cryptotermes secundus]|nr:transcription factor IIIB 90 kDa subunit isoform X1 [Cryptotermes secundus]XP_023727509.1 transcription factor IIIB 90 kDa subunit isoform X1 [Cryptotermes secundus]XP_023727510.1 transcription factor IIIB 90 kDa subunit isoform X1 [Cryptotermes secundus]